MFWGEATNEAVTEKESVICWKQFWQVWHVFFSIYGNYTLLHLDPRAQSGKQHQLTFCFRNTSRFRVALKAEVFRTFDVSEKDRSCWLRHQLMSAHSPSLSWWSLLWEQFWKIVDLSLRPRNIWYTSRNICLRKQTSWQ